MNRKEFEHLKGCDLQLVILANRARRVAVKAEEAAQEARRELMTFRQRHPEAAMDPARCIREVSESGRFGGFHRSQCSRSNGHGPDGMYCKQHAKMFSEEG